MTDKETTKDKVLYFDDDPFINSALAQTLSLFNWDVLLVPDIDILFKELKTHHFNIIIMDIMAPIPQKNNKYICFTSKEIDEMEMGLNVGVVLAKKIWKEINQTIPILFLSVKSNPIPNDFELSHFNCDFLRKPQLAKDVDEKLRLLLNKNNKAL